MERKDTKIEDGIYLRKDWSGYRVIYPYKNEDKTWNFKNILIGGSWWNLVKTIIIVLLVLFMVWSYKHDIKAYEGIVEKCVNEPCEWCIRMTQAEGNVLPSLNDFVNISEYINITK